VDRTLAPVAKGRRATLASDFDGWKRTAFLREVLLRLLECMILGQTVTALQAE